MGSFKKIYFAATTPSGGVGMIWYNEGYATYSFLESDAVESVLKASGIICNLDPIEDNRFRRECDLHFSIGDCIVHERVNYTYWLEEQVNNNAEEICAILLNPKYQVI